VSRFGCGIINAGVIARAWIKQSLIKYITDVHDIGGTLRLSFRRRVKSIIGLLETRLNTLK